MSIFNRKLSTESELWRYLSSTTDFTSIDSSCSDFPLANFKSLSSVKAIVLGADPTNPSERRFERVFGLKNPKSAYFRGIKDNLKAVGLRMPDVFVQNVCRNYFNEVTNKNDEWEEVARLWVPILKKELDSQFDRNIPVLLTAKKIFNVLVNDRDLIRKPVKEFYDEVRFIQANENLLGRLLIPFYRHPAYRLKLWPVYGKEIDNLICRRERAEHMEVC